MFDKENLTVECPGCKRTFKVQLATLRRTKTLTCRWCKREIAIKGNLGNELKRVERATEKFKRQAKQLSRTTKIKF